MGREPLPLDLILLRTAMESVERNAASDEYVAIGRVELNHVMAAKGDALPPTLDATAKWAAMSGCRLAYFGRQSSRTSATHRMMTPKSKCRLTRAVIGVLRRISGIVQAKVNQFVGGLPLSRRPRVRDGSWSHCLCPDPQSPPRTEDDADYQGAGICTH
jgi:hypothetical protein